MIKLLATSMFAYTITATLISYFLISNEYAIGVFVGGITMLVNLGGLAAFWKLIFSKKLIALAMLIIIFKYLILAVVLWALYTYKWLNPVGFFIGLASLLFGVFMLLIVKQLLKKVV